MSSAKPNAWRYFEKSAPSRLTTTFRAPKRLASLSLSGDVSSASQPPLIAAALVGACLGFLPHNFSPARIFMGDSGAMFIGLAMAGAIVSGSKLDYATFGPRSTIALLAPLIVALAVVFIPVLDFLLAVIRRTREGRHPFSADKQHLHHRMLAIGHTHRQAVVALYSCASERTEVSDRRAAEA